MRQNRRRKEHVGIVSCLTRSGTASITSCLRLNIVVGDVWGDSQVSIFHELARQRSVELSGHLMPDVICALRFPKYAVASVVGFLKARVPYVARQFSGKQRNFNGELLGERICCFDRWF